MLGLIDAVLWTERHLLPSLSASPGTIDPATLTGPLPGINVLVAGIEALGMSLLLTAALLYLVRPGPGWETRWLPPAVVFAAFAHVHYMLFPTVYSDVVSTGDLLRLGFSGTLLLGLLWEIRRTYFSERARAVELTQALEAQQARVEELEEVDRARARLFGSLTHELMHPVAAIRSLTLAMLKRWDDLEDDRRREMISVLDGETARLRELTDRTAMSTQMEAGTFRVSPRPQRAGDLARQAVQACAPAPIVLEVDPAADGATVMADPPRVLQVFQNLLSNAVKYSPKGSPIELTARDAGREVVLPCPTAVPASRPGSGRGSSRPTPGWPPTAAPPDSAWGCTSAERSSRPTAGGFWVDGTEGNGSRFPFALPRAPSTR